MNETKNEYLLSDETSIIDMPKELHPSPELKHEQSGPYIYAEMKKRYSAMLIDILFLLVVIWGFSEVRNSIGGTAESIFSAMLVIFLVCYEPICISFACTLGQYLSKIRVRNSSEVDKRINIFSSFLRYPLKLILGAISFLTIRASSKGQAIHDLAAGSVVINLAAYQMSRE